MTKAKCMAENSSALCSSIFNWTLLLHHNYYSHTFIYLWWPAANKLSPYHKLYCVILVAVRKWRPTSPPHPPSSHSVSNTLFLLQASCSPCVSLNAPLFTISSQTTCARWETRLLQLSIRMLMLPLLQCVTRFDSISENMFMFYYATTVVAVTRLGEESL